MTHVEENKVRLTGKVVKVTSCEVPSNAEEDPMDVTKVTIAVTRKDGGVDKIPIRAYRDSAFDWSNVKVGDMVTAEGEIRVKVRRPFYFVYVEVEEPPTFW